jgi:hypothetical protein
VAILRQEVEEAQMACDFWMNGDDLTWKVE